MRSTTLIFELGVAVAVVSSAYIGILSCRKKFKKKAVTSFEKCKRRLRTINQIDEGSQTRGVPPRGLRFFKIIILF